MTRTLARFALTLLAAGCSVVVNPTNEVRCTTEGGCPSGFSCETDVGGTEGICRVMCMPPGIPEECNGRDDDCDGLVDEDLGDLVEECNGSDDDCDGLVDEGHDINGDGTITADETFDRDEDGFNRCGTSECDEPDGSCSVDPEKIDCDDDDSSINPRAPEECDATDHNCDGAAFPPGEPNTDTCIAPRDGLCGGGQVCEIDRGCIALDCASGRSCTDCDVRQLCESGVCIDIDCDSTICEGMNQFCDSSSPDCQDKRDNGADCNRDLECQSGFCAAGNALGLPGSGVCFEPCCSDSECPSGEFCYGPGTGARSCIRPRPGLEAITGRTAVGVGGPGAGCGTGSDCRSGRCEGSTCWSACGQSSDCPASCGITDEGLGCRAGGEIGDACSTGGQCAMEACGTSSCLTQACTETSSCPGRSGLQANCDYGVFSLGSLQAAATCFYDVTPPSFPSLPNRAHGEFCDVTFCSSAGDCCADPVCLFETRAGCQSGVCINNRCTVACCDDATCAPFGEVCRPQRISIEGGTFFPMHCVPPT